MAARWERTVNRRDLLKGTMAAAAAMAMSTPVAVGASAQEAAAEQVLRLTASEPDTLDLALIGGGPAIQMANFLFEGLTVYDWEQQQVVPGASERWDISADNLVLTFHLRQGMVWSDGSPLTAGDFEFAVKRSLDPALAGNLASFFFPLKGAEDYFLGTNPDPNSIAITALDDLTLEMTLNAVTPYWLVILSLWPSMPLKRAAVEQGGENWTEPEFFVSNGRYKLESWEHDQGMVLVRNDQYHGEKPGIERIEYTIFQDPMAQALNAFQTGDVDMAQVSVANADFVANDPELSQLRVQTPVSGTWELRLDMANTASVIADVNVRKALYLGIDRDVLTQNVLKAFNTPAYILTPPDIPSYDPNNRLQGTIEDAKRYLADAGFPDGQGFPGFQLGYAATQENAQLVSEALLQMWKENLGIDATAFAVPTDWRQRIRTESYDMYFGQWVTDFPDPYEWHNVIFDGDAWQSKWNDATYLDLIKRANAEPDATARYALYAEAERYLIQEVMATIPLFTSGRVSVIQPWVKNLKISPYDGPIMSIREVVIEEH